jgi:hypothetical protein
VSSLLSLTKSHVSGFRVYLQALGILNFISKDVSVMRLQSQLWVTYLLGITFNLGRERYRGVCHKKEAEGLRQLSL